MFIWVDLVCWDPWLWILPDCTKWWSKSHNLFEFTFYVPWRQWFLPLLIVSLKVSYWKSAIPDSLPCVDELSTVLKGWQANSVFGYSLYQCAFWKVACWDRLSHYQMHNLWLYTPTCDIENTLLFLFSSQIIWMVKVNAQNCWENFKNLWFCSQVPQYPSH